MRSLMQEDTQFSKELIEHLLVDLSIWIPRNFYTKLPVILPYVVRDNSCRIKTSSGHDEWGSANSRGYLRDDNTLLKGIVRSFPIKSANIPTYDGKKLGTGFVASHVWGKITVDNNHLISSRHHMLNSFVPNLVWLPVQISKLTDREGSYAQRFLQAISCQIYKNISLPKELLKVWDILPCPQQVPTISVNLEKLNYFDVSGDWLTARVNGLISEIDEIISIEKQDFSKKVKIKSSRYLPTLKQIPIEQRQEMNDWLSNYRKHILALKTQKNLWSS
jgi:hypothetical protein